MIKGYKTLKNVKSLIYTLSTYYGNVRIPILSIKCNGIHFNGPVTKLGVFIVDCSLLDVGRDPPLLSEAVEFGYDYLLDWCVRYLSSQGCCNETGITKPSDLNGYYISGYLVKKERDYSIILKNIKKLRRKKGS